MNRPQHIPHRSQPNRRQAMISLAALPLTAAQAHGAGPASTARIVVLDGTLTEIVIALGAASQIVGTVSGADDLPEMAHIHKLPGFRQTSAESILALRPDLLLMGSDRALPQTLEQVESAGVKVLKLGEEATQAAAEQRILRVAEVLSRTAQGKALAQKFSADMHSALKWVSAARSRPKAVFILAGGGRPTVAGGRGTNTAALLEMAGARNVASDFEGYKIMSQEALLMAAPEFILTNAEGLAPAATGPAVLSAPGARETPAARAGRVITVAGRFLQGLGLSTPEGIRALGVQLHPELA